MILLKYAKIVMIVACFQRGDSCLELMLEFEHNLKIDVNILDLIQLYLILSFSMISTRNNP